MDLNIQEQERRFSGAFFTPKEWVLRADDLIEESLGSNWKEEYVVWDCCCGTGNLTKDKSFTNLYSSTLEQSELDYMIQNNFNPGSVKFQYDFLSEMDLDHCPDSLKAIFNDPNKKVLFYINPPFKNAGSGMYSMYEKGINQNPVYRYMISNKFGKTSSQLFSQFLSKIQCLSKECKCEIKIAFFSPFNFYSGNSFNSIRNNLFKTLSFQNGFIFNANEFSDVGQWPIQFSILKNEENQDSLLKFKIIDDEDILKYKTIPLIQEEDILYRNPNIDDDYIDVPAFSSGLEYNDIIKQNVSYVSSLANINYLSNVVDNATKPTYILSASPVTGVLYNMIESNFLTRIALFTSRKLVDLTWINSKDTFKTPTFSDPRYNQFVSDGIIYTLFNGSNQASSLRNIIVQNKTFQIFNKLFWRTCNEIKEIANQKGNQEVYQDCVQYNQERYVPTILPDHTFSPDAQLVLNKANEILLKTFDFRQQAHNEHPEWHVNTWDMGWYQINKMMKEYDPESIKEFNILYKSLRSRMQPLVYELGFLNPPYYTE